ncbi:MAG TPA: hypothetical protein VNU46_02930 [Gemmatimonadaceae bacterium]|nr:hypothetical protein [Gemmatimonadaceae bacterium]
MADPRDTAVTVLNRIAIDAALAALTPTDRAVVELMSRYRAPMGYTGEWPATPEEVGEYLGATFPEFRGRPVTGRTVWRRYEAILARWAEAAATDPTRRAA